MASKKRSGLFILTITLMVLATVSLAWPQEKYPSRSVEMVIPFPAGGSADISARIFARELSRILKVPVVPVTKAGSSGTIGGTYAHKAKKDGYTLLAGSQGWFFGSIILEVIYDPLKDFIPIANFHILPHVLCVKKDSPIKTLDDFVARAKKEPGTIPVGHPGIGGDSYFNLQVFLQAAGVQIKQVPFAGVGDLPSPLLGGHIEAAIGPAFTWIPFIRSGDIRALGITTRMKEIPDALTFQERGFRGRYFDNWAGVFCPAGVPQPVVVTLTDACEGMLKSKEFIESTEKAGCILGYMNGAEFTKRLEEDRKVIDAMAHNLGLKK